MFQLIPKSFTRLQRCIAFCVVLLTLAWLCRAPDWEPAIAFFVALGVFLFAEYRQEQTPSSPPPFDRIYDTDSAKDFYAAIAPLYDARNSSFLLQTHRKVIARIGEHLETRETWHVLDLGAGTGQLVASHFFEFKGQWTAVDACAGMMAEFQRNMRNVRLKTHLVIEDLDAFVRDPRPAKSFDVVLIVLVLSSRSADPNWRRISRLVKPGGILIVADIEPSYTAIHPHYSVIVDNATHALRTRPVHLSALATSMAKVGLKNAKFDAVMEEKTTYSFVATFTKTSEE